MQANLDILTMRGTHSSSGVVDVAACFLHCEPDWIPVLQDRLARRYDNLWQLLEAGGWRSGLHHVD